MSEHNFQIMIYMYFFYIPIFYVVAVQFQSFSMKLVQEATFVGLLRSYHGASVVDFFFKFSLPDLKCHDGIVITLRQSS